MPSNSKFSTPTAANTESLVDEVVNKMVDSGISKELATTLSLAGLTDTRDLVRHEPGYGDPLQSSSQQRKFRGLEVHAIDTTISKLSS